MRKLPPPIEQSKLDTLVARLQAGDRSVEKEIIEGHLYLARRIARAKKNEYRDRDDLECEAYYAIVKAVRQAARGALIDRNITPFIITYIQRYVKEYLSDKLFGVPARTVRHWNQMHDERARNLPHEFSFMKSSPLTHRYDDNEETVNLKYNFEYIEPQVLPQTDEIDIEEIIEKLPNNSIQQQILELKKEGYNLNEIGEAVGYSRSRVGQLLTEMEEKFDEIMKRVS